VSEYNCKSLPQPWQKTTSRPILNGQVHPTASSGLPPDRLVKRFRSVLYPKVPRLVPLTRIGKRLFHQDLKLVPSSKALRPKQRLPAAFPKS
jgi:hypothetical protein